MNQIQCSTAVLLLSFLCFSCHAFSQGTWTSKTPMPVPLYGAASGVINGQLYAASGCCVTNSFPFTRFNTLQVYDPAANTWAMKATIPHAIYGAAAGVIDGKLYVAGGQADPTNGNLIPDLQIYDPASDSWTTGAPLPEATQGGNAGVINGKLYVAGGSTSSGIVSTVVVYDPVANTWTNLASMPNPRASAGTAVINGVLYVVGGTVVVNSTSVAVNTVDSYNPATNTWTTLAPMPTARIAIAAADVDGILYAAGGQDNINTTFATVEAYDPATNTWATAPSMLTATYLPAAGVINSTFYVAGGNTISQQLVSATQAFAAPTLNPADVTLASSAHPAFVDESILFSAVVSGQGPIPTGFVTFKEGTTVLGTVPLVPLINGRTSIRTIFPNIVPGAKTQTFVIVASYLGDQNYGAADSKPLKQVVNLSKTSTVLVSNLNPSIYGQPIKLTTTVANSKPLPTAFVPAIPTGIVRFSSAGKPLGSATLGGGVATIIISPPAGGLSITAAYGGDAAHIASTSPSLKLVVRKAISATTIASSVNPSNAEQTVTFTARVTSSTTTPVGQVRFMDGNSILGTERLTNGTATFSTSTLAVGLHRISAIYDGTANIDKSISPKLVQRVK